MRALHAVRHRVPCVVHSRGELRERLIQRLWLFVVVAGVLLPGCRSPIEPSLTAPGRDAPFPPTWTPTALAEETATATLVVHPTPTWDGTPPPPEPALVPRVSPSRLRRALDGEAVEGFRDEVTVVDVGNRASYEQAHIPGALHLVGHELVDRAGELDSSHTVVLYDLWPDERAGAEAALVLYALGFTDVAVLEGGIQLWYAAGYGIEGTWLTPTPEPGPPWTLTPLMPETEVTATVTTTLTTSDASTPTVTVAVPVTPSITISPSTRATLTATLAPSATPVN